MVLLEKEEQSDRDEVEMLRQALAEKKAQLEEEIANEHATFCALLYAADSTNHPAKEK